MVRIHHGSPLVSASKLAAHSLALRAGTFRMKWTALVFLVGTFSWGVTSYGAECSGSETDSARCIGKGSIFTVGNKSIEAKPYTGQIRFRNGHAFQGGAKFSVCSLNTTYLKALSGTPIFLMEGKALTVTDVIPGSFPLPTVIYEFDDPEISSLECVETLTWDGLLVKDVTQRVSPGLILQIRNP